MNTSEGPNSRKGPNGTLNSVFFIRGNIMAYGKIVRQNHHAGTIQVAFPDTGTCYEFKTILATEVKGYFWSDWNYINVQPTDTQRIVLDVDAGEEGQLMDVEEIATNQRSGGFAYDETTMDETTMDETTMEMEEPEDDSNDQTAEPPADHSGQQRLRSQVADDETYLVPFPIDLTGMVPLPSKFKGKMPPTFGYEPQRRPSKRTFAGNPVQPSGTSNVLTGTGGHSAATKGGIAKPDGRRISKATGTSVKLVDRTGQQGLGSQVVDAEFYPLAPPVDFRDTPPLPSKSKVEEPTTFGYDHRPSKIATKLVQVSGTSLNDFRPTARRVAAPLPSPLPSRSPPMQNTVGADFPVSPDLAAPKDDFHFDSPLKERKERVWHEFEVEPINDSNGYDDAQEVLMETDETEVISTTSDLNAGIIVDTITFPDALDANQEPPERDLVIDRLDQNLPETTSGNLTEVITENLPESIAENITEAADENLPEEATGNPMEETTENSTEETTGNSTEEITENSTEETTGNSTEEITANSTEENTENSTEETAENSTEETAENLPEVTAENLREVTAENLPEVTADNLTEVTTGNLNEAILYDQSETGLVEPMEIAAVEPVDGDSISQNIDSEQHQQTQVTDEKPDVMVVSSDEILQKAEYAQDTETQFTEGGDGIVLNIDEILESAVVPEIQNVNEENFESQQDDVFVPETHKMDEETVQPQKDDEMIPEIKKTEEANVQSQQDIESSQTPSTSADALKKSVETESRPKRRLRSNSGATIETPPPKITRKRSSSSLMLAAEPSPSQSTASPVPRMTRAKSETRSLSNQSAGARRVRASSEIKTTRSEELSTLSAIDSMESATASIDIIPKKVKRTADRNFSSPINTPERSSLRVTRSRTQSIAEEDDDNVSVISEGSHRSTRSATSKSGRSTRSTRLKSTVDEGEDDGTPSKKSQRKPRILPSISEDQSQEAQTDNQTYEDGRRLTRLQRRTMADAAKRVKSTAEETGLMVAPATRKRARRNSTADADDDDISDTASVASSKTNRSRKSTDSLTPVRQSQRLLEKEGSVDKRSVADKDSDTESVGSVAKSTKSAKSTRSRRK